MTEYSEAFKSKMVQRMTGPRGKTATALASEVGISQPTLSRWLRSAQATVAVMSKAPAQVTDRASEQPEPPPKVAKRPEDWSPEERLRAVVEGAKLSDTELGAFLRREGLHEATLRQWRAAALEGLGPQRSTRSEQKRVQDLEKELRRKDKALAEAAALLVLQKKTRAIWGDGDDDTEAKNEK
jgi:transposase-like protein